LNQAGFSSEDFPISVSVSDRESVPAEFVIYFTMQPTVSCCC